MKISALNDKKKSIDTAIFNMHKKELEGSDIKSRAIPNSSSRSKIDNYFYQSHDGSYVLDEYNEKKEKIKETKLRADKKIEVTEKIDEYFTYNETYFSSGNIESKSISSKLGFTVGMKYLYNEKGSVIERINTDEGYGFSFEDVFKFCQDKQLSFETTSFPFRIYKTTRPSDNVKLWVIEYPDEKAKKIITYVLQGSDGAVLNRIEKDWPVFIHNQ